MEIQPKVAVGIFAGLISGGLIAGKICARYTLLHPAHAALFSLAAVITAYVLHRGIQWYYGASYKNLPLPLKLITNMSIATLVTGAIAGDYFGVDIAISAALKIMAGSLITATLGWFIGKNLSRPAVSTGQPAP